MESKALTPKGRNVGDFGMYTTQGNWWVEHMVKTLLRMPITTSPKELSAMLKTTMAAISKIHGEIYDTVVRENILEVIAKNTHRKIGDFDI